MTIITKPSLVTKNEAAQFTLNKAELSNHASVVANTYFHDTTNWKEVLMKFTSTSGNQIEVLVFDATLASPTANFLVSEHARNGFEINHITIMDHDGGSLHIGQMDLNLPDFDVTVSDPASTPSSSPIVWDILGAGVVTNGNGELHTTNGGWNSSAFSSAPITGNFTISGIFHSVIGGGTNMMIGYLKNLPSSISGSPSANTSTSLYVDGGVSSVVMYNGADGTSTPVGIVANADADFNYEIARVGSFITAKVNGATIFTDSNYSGPVYPCATIYSNNGYSILSSSKA